MAQKLSKETLYGKDARDLLARWDEGRNIFTISMGGLGPGYEQAIRCICMEIIRDKIDKPFPTTNDELKTWGDDTLSRLDDNLRGCTGAMWSAARSLAYNFLKLNPVGAIEVYEKAGKSDRIIQASKNWP